MLKQRIRRFFLGLATLPSCDIVKPQFSDGELGELDISPDSSHHSVDPSLATFSLTALPAQDTHSAPHKRREMDFHKRQHNRKHIKGVFHEPVGISQLNLEQCRITWQPRHSLSFERCMFVNCDIRIVQDNERTQDIRFDRCVFKDCSITYASEGIADAFFDYDDPREPLAIFDSGARSFRNTRLAFDGCRATGCHINTIARAFELHQSPLKHCRLRGYAGIFHADGTLDRCDIRTVGDEWHSARLDVVGGVWHPHIRHRMEVSATQFDGTLIDVSQIARTCTNKEGIDVQRAEINDIWETLRDEFTGTRFFLHLTMVGAFVLPIVLNALMLAAYASAYEMGKGALSAWFGKKEVAHLPLAEVLAFGGYDGTAKWLHLGMFVGLVLYNVVRFSLTMWVGALREREVHRATLGFTLCRPPDSHLVWPWRLRTTLNWFLIVALAATVWHLAEFMFISIPYIER